MDEMWSYYHDKSRQIWLWWAVDHATNTPIAYTFGTREHKYLDELLSLLKPFNIGIVYADKNYAYRDRIPAEKLVTGKKNTQQIERNHLTLRTRIKRLCRKTICFSKDKNIHKTVIGTFINIFFFGRTLNVSTIL
jgi:insertion element IS1 protein InsB